MGTAIREIVGEIERVQEEQASQEEVLDTQSYLQGIFPFTLQRIEGLADRLADMALYDLPDDYFTSFFEKVGAVTGDELQELAQRHLDPQGLAIAAVGPRRILEDQLTPFGKPEFHPFSSQNDAPEQDL